MLTRAPTLHRLGIQAFEPVLVDGKAIQVHPLVCHALNADFDGDQMAVHVPLSEAAQAEARVLMLSTQNLFSPASGVPIVAPIQDIVLGMYYLTEERPGGRGEGAIFGTAEEAILAYDSGDVELGAKVKCRITAEEQNGNSGRRIIETTPGRLILNEILPPALRYQPMFISKPQDKKAIAEM